MMKTLKTVRLMSAYLIFIVVTAMLTNKLEHKLTRDLVESICQPDTVFVQPSKLTRTEFYEHYLAALDSLE